MRRGLLFRQLELGEIVHVAATVWRMRLASPTVEESSGLADLQCLDVSAGISHEGAAAQPHDEMQDNREAA